MKYIIPICLTICFFLLLNSCKNKVEPVSMGTNIVVKTNPYKNHLKLKISVPQSQVRGEAGLETPIITTLMQGDSMYYLNEKSDFTTTIKLQGKTYNMPWLKVAVKDTIAWVYAGAVEFNQSNYKGKELLNSMKYGRLLNVFGETISNRIERQQKGWVEAATDEEMHILYQRMETLRDTLMGRMNQIVDLNETDTMPDFFWMQPYLRGLIVQKVAEGTQYYLFMDYRQFLKKAAQTAGESDDNFAQIQVMVYPDDSIEYSFPGWFLQTWDYGGHSLLGRGKHKAMLDELSQRWDENQLFHKELLTVKDEVIEDVADGNGYWESQENILAEVDTIIGSKYVFLNEEDLIILKTRRNMLVENEKFGIKLNQQEGEAVQ